MKNLDKIFPKKLYHSYVIEGDPNILPNKIIELLKKRGELEEKSPNLLIQEYESFAIKDSVVIKEWHSKLALGSRKKFCILSTKFINREAEQSLLKIIEEPGLDTHIFIIIPDSSVLLDTIISRVQVIKITEEGENEMGEVAKLFISSKIKEKLTLVDKFIKENTEEGNSGKLRHKTIELLNELELVFYPKFKNGENTNSVKILGEIKKGRSYLRQPGSSAKYILQNLALII